LAQQPGACTCLSLALAPYVTTTNDDVSYPWPRERERIAMNAASQVGSEPVLISPVHALHIESGGNQRYIFASNKLREAVGASQLVLEAGTSLVIEAMQQSKVTPLPHSWDAAAVLRTALADAERSPRLERHQVEIQQLLSGRAVVLAGNRELAEAVGRAVTRAALLKAPGLDLACGIAGPARDDETLADVLLAAAQDRNARAAHNAGAAVRFGRLPVVDECATTGLPASRWVTEKAFPRGAALSRVALAKRRAADRGIARMIALGTGSDPTEARARRTLSQLEELLESSEQYREFVQRGLPDQVFLTRESEEREVAGL